MKIVLLLFLMFQAPVEPVKLKIVTPEESAVNREFCRAVRTELNRRKVGIVSRHADFEIYLVAREISQKDKVVGYAAATLVIESQSTKSEPFKLRVFIGPSLEDMAKRFVATLETHAKP